MFSKLPMVKVSTLLYICDNLEDNNDELIDIETITRKESADYKEVWNFLDHLIFEVDQSVIKRVLNQICQL